MRCLLLLSLFVSLDCLSQELPLKGRVTDTGNVPLSGVIVELKKGEETVSFAITEKNGEYECRMPATEGVFSVSFRKLNYVTHRQNLPAGTKRLNVTLRHDVYRMQEVVVTGTPVQVLGDTIVYSLKPFLQAGDYTLEEALKRLPGIEVNNMGTISYMGRNISNFYIEGLNLLGGRYNLATRNIPADKVTGVEVLRHHQANKVDRQELTDNVALNIKLSPKAKLKPFGTYEARLGYRPGRFLYGAGGTGMLFRSSFQMLATLKLSNDGRMGRNELYDHFSVSSWRTGAESVLPLLSGSRPPMGESRFSNEENQLMSVNALQKLSDDNQFKANADYSHRRYAYDYLSTTQYPTAGHSHIVTEEQAAFLQKEHRLGLNLDLRSDKDARLVENKVLLRGRFAKAESELASREQFLSEQLTRTLGARNELSFIRRIRKWKLNFGSTVQYTDTPDNTLDISSAGGSRADVRQQAHSRAFYTKESFYTGYQLLRSLTLALPVSLSANSNRLQTLWQGDTLALNALQGWDMDVSISPRLEYQTPRRTFRATFGLPLSFITQHYRNRAYASDLNLGKFRANWAAELIFVPSGNVEWKASSYLNQGFGDMSDLLTGPVQTDYRTIRTRSGIFGQNKLFRNSLSFDWQKPLSFFHFIARAGYNRSHSNVTNGQHVTEGGQSLLEVVRNNTGDAINGHVTISKYFLPAKTSVSVDASCNWQRYESLNALQVVTTYGNAYTLGGHLSSAPVERFQVSYDLVYYRNTLHGSVSKSTSTRWRQQGRLSFTPFADWLVGVTGEWQINSLIDDGHKSFAFLDAHVEYKFKKPKLRLRFELNNMLNTRSYSYIVYDNLNTYAYDYRLNGREGLLTIVLY